MKKILSIILVLVIALSLAACGGGSSVDANTQAMQAKLDQADALVQQIGTWYADNGYLEGDTAEQVQGVVDTMVASMDVVKAEFQAIVDAGGFTDEDVAAFGPVLDSTIAAYQKAVDEQAAYDESAASGTGIAVIGAKYNQAYDLIVEASTLGTANGWDANEAYVSELNAGLTLLEATKADLENPSSMDDAYMSELNAIFDELIALWQEYLVQVSVPYTAN